MSNRSLHTLNSDEVVNSVRNHLWSLVYHAFSYMDYSSRPTDFYAFYVDCTFHEMNDEQMTQLIEYLDTMSSEDVASREITLGIDALIVLRSQLMYLGG